LWVLLAVMAADLRRRTMDGWALVGRQNIQRARLRMAGEGRC